MKPIIHPIWFYLLDIGQSLGQTLMAFGILFSIAGAIIYFNCVVAAADNKNIPKSFSRFRGFLWIGVFLCIVSGLIPSKKTGYAMMAASIVTPDNIETVVDTTKDGAEWLIDTITEASEKLTNNEVESADE